MKKKIVTMMLVTAMAASVAACGSTTEESAVSESNYEWDAGELADLGLSRDELLEIVSRCDEIWEEYEETDEYWDDTDTYDDMVMEQVAEEHGLTAEDVYQIYTYTGDVNYFATFDIDSVAVTNGEVRKLFTSGGRIILQIEIENKKGVINDCYETVCDFITDYAKDDFTELSFAAYDDDTCLVGFTLSESAMESIYAGDIDASDLGEYVDDMSTAYGVE